MAQSEVEPSVVEEWLKSFPWTDWATVRPGKRCTVAADCTNPQVLVILERVKFEEEVA